MSKLFVALDGGTILFAAQSGMVRPRPHSSVRPLLLLALRSLKMNQTDPKKHSDAKAEQRDQSKPQHGKSQGVTTNPDSVGAGGGSSPVGHSGQDSRTWGAGDNQKNASHDKGSEKQHEDRSKKADLGEAGEQVGNPGHKQDAKKSDHKH